MPDPARSRPRRIAIRLLKLGLAVFGGYFVLCVLLLATWKFMTPPATGVQVQRRVEALAAGRDYDPQREWVPFDVLPPHVPRAVVSAEDGAFWLHRGFDWAELRLARRDAVERDHPMRGASTITQQLMKNLFWTTHRNPVRKAYDFALTPAAELILGKERILELYLNEVEWGDGIFGIEAGARHHYGVSARALSRTQAAGLAALLPAPLRRTPANTGRYREEILRRMAERGW